MFDFNSIKNWKLKSGSHRFPGPDGGTCINEAAIVAEGFEYRSVKSWRDCPPCFSPIVSQFAIYANDTMSDDDRQELLLPFVTKIAGTRGSDEFEIARQTWFVRQLVNVELAEISRRLLKNEVLGAACESAETTDELKSVIKLVSSSLSSLSLSFSLSSLSSLSSSLLSSSLSLSWLLLSWLLSSLSSSFSSKRKAFLLAGLIDFGRSEKPLTPLPIAAERLHKAVEAAL